MTQKALHIYGVTAYNAGDNVLGIASKKWFSEFISNNNLAWTTESCRNDFNTQKKINWINSFDYLLIGGGGLFLPDTNPNKVSCWQWAIDKNLIRQIQIPIYVCAVGYNLFYNQSVTMPNRKNNKKDQSRWLIFKENVETLIEKSAYFSLRHNGDIEELKKIIKPSLHKKIQFQFCPTINYAKQIMPKPNTQKNLWAYEIKDDRQWRRYHKVGMDSFYSQLKDFIIYIKNNRPEISQCLLLHEAKNVSFKNYLNSHGISLPVISNSNISEEQVVKNLSKIDTLFCMAGHSQMIGSAVSARVISLISHDKLKYFLEDTESYTYENYVDLNHDDVYHKLKKITQHDY